MRKVYRAVAAICLSCSAAVAIADTTEAACEIYPRGEDHTDVFLPCTFSQRQGYITINRGDGVTHQLSPEGDAPGYFADQHGRSVIRQSGLGDQGQIFRFPEESIYLYWNADRLTVSADDSGTAPFSTQDFDATTRLRCRRAGQQAFASCPAGIVRMENSQASITVQNQHGEQFTINFMSDYVNATNRELSSRLEGDTWILNFADGEVWEVPIAAIEGG